MGESANQPSEQPKQKSAPDRRRAQLSCVVAAAQAATAAFLASSRFTLRARGLSLVSAVFSSQLSRPPLCSTERRPWVDTRNLKLRSSTSESSVTFCRL